MDIKFDIHRLMNTSLLMEHKAARSLFGSLISQIPEGKLLDAGGEMIDAEKPRIKSFYGSYSNDRYRPYRVEDGIAVIPVNGSLFHKWPYIGRYSCGYDALISAVEEAVVDRDIEAALIDFDTPGGEVAGCFDASDRLFELAQQMPIASLCYDMHCSAGQALASACSYNMMTQTGEAGSIGVVMAHSDYSKQLEEMLGVNITLIYSGAEKIDGNPYEQLPEGVVKKFQQEVDDLRLQFAGIVSRNLDLSVDQVLATEAAIFRAQDAIDAGLCDVIVNGHQAVSAFREYLSTQGRSILGATMSANNENSSKTQSSGTSVAPVAAADGEGTTEQLQQPVAIDQRERIKGILQSPEAQGRNDLANHFAYDTDISMEDAIKALAKAPVSGSDDAGASASIDALMSQETQPDLSADGAQISGKEGEGRVAEMVGAHKLATGR